MSNISHLEHDSRFDRLVDGELDDEEYRELLATLDDRPEGWRRCALAFLEAQNWGNEFKGVLKETDPPKTLAHVPSRAANKLGTLLAMAACFLVALFLGMYLRSWNSNEQKVPSNDSLVVEHESQVDMPLDDKHEPKERTVVHAESRSNEPLGNVRFVLHEAEDEKNRFVDVPFYELDRMDPKWYSDSAFSIPPNVIRELNQRGHQVRRDQRLIPVDLQNGRRVVIPIEQFEIVPVGGPYQ